MCSIAHVQQVGCCLIIIFLLLINSFVFFSFFFEGGGGYWAGKPLINLATLIQTLDFNNAYFYDVSALTTADMLIIIKHMTLTISV